MGRRESGVEQKNDGGKFNNEQLQDPESDEEIVASLRHDISSAEWLLLPLYRQWYEYALWTYGEQYMEYNWRTRRFQVRGGKNFIPRSTTNLILPNVELGISLFLDSMPDVKYLSETKKDSDRAAAEVSQGVMRFRDQEGRFERKKRDIADWCVITGTAWAMVTEGKANARRFQIQEMERGVEPVIDEVTGEPITGPGGVPVMKEWERPAIDKQTGRPVVSEIVAWDEETEICSPFEIIPDWSARHPYEFRRFTHYRCRTREWIARTYGSALAKRVEPERGDGNRLTGYYQLKMLDIIARASATSRFGLPSGSGLGVMSDYRYMEDSATVITRYMLPTTKYPKGRVLACAGDVVLDDSEYTDRFGERLNLYGFRWSILPGSVWGFGMPRNLIPLQRRLNGIDTQNDLIRKVEGNPQWLVAKGSQFSRGLGTSEPGHINTYKHSGGRPMPSRIESRGAHASNFEQRNAILIDFETISGMIHVLRGQNPAGVTAGVSLELLTEQAGKRFNPCVDDNRDEFRHLNMHRLEMARRSNAWKMGRDVAVDDENGERDMQHWSDKDFTGSVTVTCEAVPITARSTALRIQRMLTGVKLGLVDLSNSPQNRDKARQLLALNEFDEAYGGDYKRAQMENEQILAGQAVKRQKFDNDEVHAYTHLRAMVTTKWEDYPDGVKEEFLRHLLEEHMMRLVPPMQDQAAAGGGKATSMTPGENAALPTPTGDPTIGGGGMPPMNGGGNGLKSMYDEAGGVQ